MTKDDGDDVEDGDDYNRDQTKIRNEIKTDAAKVLLDNYIVGIDQQVLKKESACMET